LTCPVCSIKYDNKERRPIIGSPCGHSSCQICIENSQKRCAICQEPFIGTNINSSLTDAVDKADSKTLAALDKEIESTIRGNMNEVDEQGKTILDNNGIESYLSQKTWKEVIIKVADDDRDKLIARLEELGYPANPSKFQAKMIPFGLSKKNVGILAQSSSSSGKTLGFMITAILRVDLSKPLTKTKITYLPQVIILARTQELCSSLVRVGEQIAEVFPELKISTGKEPAHIIVKTPGGLLQLMGKKVVDLSYINLLVVDEANLQLQGDCGVQLNHCISFLPPETSLFFFSVSFDKEQIDDIKMIFERLRIESRLDLTIVPKELELERLMQFSRRCDQNGKIDYITKLMKNLKADMQVIIFVNSKESADVIANSLEKEGLSVGFLTGSDDQLSTILNQFREGKFKILITRNLLAKDFDQRTIGLVINFDLPIDSSSGPEGTARKVDLATYLHRVGRTGRFGDCGLVLDLYSTEAEKEMINDIEKYYGVQITDLSKEDVKEFDLLNNYLDQIEKLNKQKRE